MTQVEEVTKLAGLPMVSLSPDMIHMFAGTQGTVANTMDQINGIVFHRTAHHSSKEDFEEASQAELPAGIWGLVDELLRDMQTRTDWINAVIDSQVRSDPTLNGLVVEPIAN
jgi:hypothetical protein